MKKALIVLAVFILAVCSFNRRLDRIAGIMNEYPAEALASLDSIGSGALKTPRLRARYALLRSIALDKNYIDLKSDSIIAPAVSWFQRHGKPLEKAQTYYYSGRIAYNAEDYPTASVLYKKAEALFPQFEDDYLKRLILIALAQTNNASFFFEENLDFLQCAKQLLPTGAPSDHEYIIDLAIGNYYNNTLQWKKADSVYTAIERSIDHDNPLYLTCLKNHGRLLINMEPEDPAGSYTYFEEASSKGAKFYPEDALAYAVSLYYAGNKETALALINQVEGIGRYDAQVLNTRYRIDMIEGNYPEAVAHQQKAYVIQDSVIFASFRQSVVKAQRDFYEESSARIAEKARSQSIIIWFLIIIFGLLVLVGIALYSRKMAFHAAEMEKLGSIVTQSESLLKQAVEEKESYKAKYIEKFKAQFVTIREMTENYLQTKGRSDQKEYIFAKVAELSEEVCDDKEGILQLEKQLNQELDNIIHNFRKDFPNKDESTYRFVCYLIAGFDPPSISLLMNYTIGFIYKKKYRLRQEIMQTPSPHQQEYLDFISY